MNDQEGGINSGGDALNLDNGYFNCMSIPNFNQSKHVSVHAMYKKRLQT